MVVLIEFSERALVKPTTLDAATTSSETTRSDDSPLRAIHFVGRLVEMVAVAFLSRDVPADAVVAAA